ncbi:MAG: hypothetical protein ACI89U_002301 [Gammaproteobacteria bacterium]|jgi:hypothetical protein
MTVSRALVLSLTLLVLVFPRVLLAQNQLSQSVPSYEENELVIGDFRNNGLTNWQERSFVGNTRYRIVEMDGEKVLSASTRSSASALYRELDVDVEKTPILSWSWRVENVYNIDDPERKAGDDYAARLYVVVKYGFFPWQTRALNYIWCNKQTPKTSWPNPFSKKAIMIPVRCGIQGLGQWHQESVNVAEDYYRFFGHKIDKAHGVAIMSDSDNANGTAQAYYKNIVFSGR